MCFTKKYFNSMPGFSKDNIGEGANMIDFNEKYAIGKTPKEEKDKLPVVTSVSVHELTRTEIPESKAYREIVNKDTQKIRKIIKELPQKNNKLKNKEMPKKAQKSKVIYSDEKVVRCEIDKSYLKKDAVVNNTKNNAVVNNNTKNNVIVSKDTKLIPNKTSNLLKPNK